MPLYVYNCINGHQTEELYDNLSSSPTEKECPECGGHAERGVGLPCFNLSWQPKVMGAKQAWEGTPLEGTDGINPLNYESKKEQVDMGAKKQVSGKSKPRPTSGVGALGW